MGIVYTRRELQDLVAPILKKYGAQGASLFGSYARGTAGPDSDIDLVVHGGPTFELTNVFAVAEDLFQESGKNVDVFEDSELDPSSEFVRAVRADQVALV